MGKPLPQRIWGWVGQFRRKLDSAGPGELWAWAYGHGIPTVFGIPIMRYHKITEQIYLGPQHGKLAHRRFANLGIAASVNMRTGYSDVENGIGFGEYLQLPTTDGEAPTLEQLYQGCEFIRRIVRRGESVYIHCQTGLGRGPTMAAAFLIGEGRSMEDAIAAIKHVRPFTDLQPSQLAALRRFEADCRDSRSGSETARPADEMPKLPAI